MNAKNKRQHDEVQSDKTQHLMKHLQSEAEPQPSESCVMWTMSHYLSAKQMMSTLSHAGPDSE